MTVFVAPASRRRHNTILARLSGDENSRRDIRASSYFSCEHWNENYGRAVYKLSVGSGVSCEAMMSSPEYAAAPVRRPSASSAEMRATSGLLLFAERCARTT